MHVSIKLSCNGYLNIEKIKTDLEARRVVRDQDEQAVLARDASSGTQGHDDRGMIVVAPDKGMLKPQSRDLNRGAGTCPGTVWTPAHPQELGGTWQP